MRDAGVISGVSVSHGDATVDEIDAATNDDVSGAVSSLLTKEGVDEAFALQTCNRAEAYVVTESVADGRRALEGFAPDVRDGALTPMDHEESLRHLMRVAAGLESLVLGEDQIIGQVKDAAEATRKAGGLGPVLEDALTKAVHVGERARTETAINEGAVSLGSAAVDLAASEVDVESATALVVGAGEMGTLTAHSLARADVDRLVVANRTLDTAATVAEEVPADADVVGLDVLGDAVADADVVIAATGSDDPVVDAATVAGAGETFVVDIAQPRDVSPDAAAVDGVTVRDIDDLESVTQATRERRESAARRVETMIDEEFERLIAGYKRRQADEAISAMYESAETVKQREVDTALAKLESQGSLTDDQRETVSALADALVGQLLAAPTKSLRDAAAEDDWATIQTAMRLFDPEFGGGAAEAGAEDADSAPVSAVEGSSDD